MTVDQTVTWPKKTREMQSQLIDSTVWNDFRFRDDDIIISTYAKSGTTWMQQIVSQVLFDADTEVEVHAMSPWMDFQLPPKPKKLAMVEAQTHRRFMKTHLPVDALPWCILRKPNMFTLAVVRCGVFIITIQTEHCNFDGMKQISARAQLGPG